MTITDDYIIKAERLLLPEGCTFDDERRNFIKNLSTLDLIAVPGSGKTTALQAKLCCLENFMPMEQGVLVLAHTNVAVEEIKKNLLQSCPKLFEYPNFVGTIQDFVDTYLAIPYYQNKCGHSITRIDDDLYLKLFLDYMKLQRNYRDTSMYWYLHKCNSMLDTIGFDEIKTIDMHYLNLRLDIDDFGNDVLKTGNGLFEIEPPAKWGKEGTAIQKHKFIIQTLIDLKKRFALNGYLCYDDCYYFANKFLFEMPSLKQIFRKQFKYIFVDETQDLEEKQIQLIDNIFFCDECVLQRIGDVNQSILYDAWHPRNKCFIQKSFRLTQINGQLVNAFTKERFDGHLTVQGANPKVRSINPHVILFDFSTKDKIIPCYEKLISDYDLQNTDEGKKYGFHIVGWAARKKDDGHYRLKDYFPKYLEKTNTSSSQHFSTLNEYIQLGRKNDTSKSCVNSVYHIICEFARRVEYMFNERPLSLNNIKKWFTTLQENDKIIIDTFIFNATKLLITHNYESAYNYLTEGLCGKILELFGKKLSVNANLFLEDHFCLLIPNICVEQSQNDNSINIAIDKVHSVKGMTHCATLYIETYYHKEYESSHLAKIKRRATTRRSVEYYPNPLLLQNLDEGSLNSYSTQAIKMMYVGFSRPTHLLCFAMLKSNFDANSSVYTKEAFENAGWIVDDLTKDSQ